MSIRSDMVRELDDAQQKRVPECWAETPAASWMFHVGLCQCCCSHVVGLTHDTHAPTKAIPAYLIIKFRQRVAWLIQSGVMVDSDNVAGDFDALPAAVPAKRRRTSSSYGSAASGFGDQPRPHGAPPGLH